MIDDSHFLNYADTLLKVSQGFKEALASKINLCKFKKGDILVKSGELSSHIYFIRTGILRGYIMHRNKDITLWLNETGDVFTTGERLLEISPSIECIDVLEDCELEVISKVEFQELVKIYYEMVMLVNYVLVNNYKDASFRALLSKIPNAKERYKLLVSNKYGLLINKIPLKYIASFLGLRNETLSRIRAIR
jgi:CRP-like cAMP-binding protein